MPNPIVEIPSGGNYTNTTSSVTLVIEPGIVVTGYVDDFGENTAFINRGSISVNNYNYAHEGASASDVVNAVNASISSTVGRAIGSDGSLNVSNYGTISGGVFAFGSNNAVVNNYGAFSGSLYAVNDTLNLFTGSTNGSVTEDANGGATRTVNLRVDDRPTVATSADVGANSGVITGTIHDLTGFFTLNVQSGNWSLTGNETFTTTTVSSGATLGVAGYTLTTASLSLTSGAVVHDVEGATGGFSVSGTVSLGGATLDLGSGTAGAVGTSVRLIDNTGSSAVQGTFAGLAEGGTLTAGGHSYSISYTGGTGNDVVLTRIADQVMKAPAGNSYNLSTLSPGDQTGFTSNDRLYIPVNAADLVTLDHLRRGHDSRTTARTTTLQTARCRRRARHTRSASRTTRTLIVGTDGRQRQFALQSRRRQTTSSTASVATTISTSAAATTTSTAAPATTSSTPMMATTTSGAMPRTHDARPGRRCRSHRHQRWRLELRQRQCRRRLYRSRQGRQHRGQPSLWWLRATTRS